ncbi:sulfatase family protein [Carboxylicivirga marina]|uniref:sulfatase family protein n=1 Tax=Carboxylicivirga marina TaxID=2800988 RepID=UPI002597730F|nr:arylsulfatase [uncultured Carboxylicivirga sp.]
MVLYKFLKLSIAAVCLLTVCSACSIEGGDSDNQIPNIVIIYGDDVGFGDVGAYGSQLIPTPNIDALAEGGLRFTDGHCTASTCTPSRFSLLTGAYGFRYNANVLPPNAPLLIPVDMMTLPKMLKKAGYETGIVGKWHLGIGEKGVLTDWNGDVKPGPIEVGFNSSFLLPSTNDRVPTVYLEGHRVLNLDKNDSLFVGKKPYIKSKNHVTQYPDGKTNREAMTYYQSSHGHNNSVTNGIGRIGYMAGGKSALWDDETMTDVFVDKAKAYIRKNKEKPFFLYYAAQDIHVPRTPHPRFQGKTTLGYRGDAMVQFDWATGEIMKALEENGLTDNTIVIFSSDNGPVYDDGYVDGTTVVTSTEEVDNGHDGSGIYRGGKYQIYEGGTRVPFIVSWPAKIKPGVSNALVNQVDLLGSLASFLNVPLNDDEGIDSRNTMDAFLGKSEQGLPDMIEEAIKHKALRRGDWKYIPAHPRTYASPEMGKQLYNLANDPGEQNNLIEEQPEIAKSMAEELGKLINSESIRLNR